MNILTIVFENEVLSVFTSSVLGARYAGGKYYLYVSDPGSVAVGCFRMHPATMKKAADKYDNGDHSGNVPRFRPVELGWFLRWVCEQRFVQCELVSGVLSQSSGDYGSRSSASGPSQSSPHIS